MIETNTYTYTKTRIAVIEDHLQLFLKCGRIDNESIDNLTEAVLGHKLVAVGIYAKEKESGKRVSEVEFVIDWDEHNRLVDNSGEMMNTEGLPGWENGLAPEATLAVSRLVKKADKNDWELSSWIRVAPSVKKNEAEYRALCEALGYTCHSGVAEWKTSPIEMERKVTYLEETTLKQRIVAEYVGSQK